jgi:hypothetical protein
LGDGRIELNAYDTPRVSLISQGSTYNAQTELIRIGDLNGNWGYVAQTYGIGMGEYTGGRSSLVVDSINGIRIFNATTVIGQWSAAGAITIGQVSANQDNIVISSGAIAIRNNTTERIAMTAAGVLTIKDSGGAAVFTFDASAGAEFTKPLTLGASGGIYQGSGTFASPTTGLKVWNESGIGRIAGYNGGTVQWYANTDGKLYAGGGRIILDANGITINDGSPLSVFNIGGFTIYNSSGAANLQSGGGSYAINISAASNIVLSTLSGYIRLAPNSENVYINSGLNVGSATGAATGEVRSSASFYDNTRVLTPISHTLFDLRDEFMGGTTSTGNVGSLGWGLSVGTIALKTSEATHPGLVTLASGATGGNIGRITLAAIAPGDVTYMAAIVRPLSGTTTMACRIGLFSSFATKDTAQGIYWSFDAAVGLPWASVTRGASSVTRNPTSPAINYATGKWFFLEIKKSGANWEFYLNGTLRFTHSTNIPTGILTPAIVIETNEAVTKTIDIDWVRVRTNDPFSQRWT